MRKLILILAFILVGVISTFAETSNYCPLCCTPEPTTVEGQVTSKYRGAVKFTDITLLRFVDFVPDEPITVRPNVFGYYRIETQTCGLIFIVPSHSGKALPNGAIPIFTPSGAMFDMVTMPEFPAIYNVELSIWH